MKKTSIAIIQIYQAISPLLRQTLITLFGFSFGCKQSPSCSEFTINQIEKHGTITGLKRGLVRIMTCYPLFQP